jgi:Protein ENHANCED DISEASE RESISTANCE 2, C-terminal
MKAGTTLRRSIVKDTDKEASACADCSWDECSASKFNLRAGPDYSRNKKKSPSPPSIMDVVGVE